MDEPRALIDPPPDAAEHPPRSGGRVRAPTMTPTFVRALALGLGCALLNAGYSVAAGQNGPIATLFEAAFTCAAMTWLTLRSLRRAPSTAAAAPASAASARPRYGLMVGGAVLYCVVSWGLMAWRGTLRAEAYWILPFATAIAFVVIAGLTRLGVRMENQRR